MAYEIIIGDETLNVSIEKLGVAQFKVNIEGKGEFMVDAHRTEPTTFSIIMDGKSHEVDLEELDDSYNIYLNGGCYPVQVLDERRKLLNRTKNATTGKQIISTTMPGKIVDILVKVGDVVEEGQALLVVEAMKMENELKSPKKGKVVEILVQKGDTVEAGKKLAVIE